MKALVSIAALLVPLGISLIFFPEGFFACLVCVPLVVVTLALLNRDEVNGPFLMQLFILAFLARIIVASAIFGFGAMEFFGSDALVHEFHGYTLLEVWEGRVDVPYFLNDWAKPWGLYNLIAAVYFLIGRNYLAICFISAFCGAATSVLVFLCAQKIFNNLRTAKFAALLTAFLPAMIIWSSQVLKDGFVVFFVVLVIYFLTKLQEQFNWLDVVFLLLSLFAVFSLRNYVFYFAAFACVGSFAFGSERVLANNFRWLGIMTLLVAAFAYTGALSVGTEQLERLSDIENIQYSRTVLTREAESGYGAGTDITTTGGALAALPIGLANLLLAPFPWQFGSLRSTLPLPEMLVWWALFPFLFAGIKYTLFNRFRKAVPMMLFTITLTIVYALFQTNVGTAYRQRTQIQVFLFMFIAVGWTLFQERRDDKKILSSARRQRPLVNNLELR